MATDPQYWTPVVLISFATERTIEVLFDAVESIVDCCSCNENRDSKDRPLDQDDYTVPLLPLPINPDEHNTTSLPSKKSKLVKIKNIISLLLGLIVAGIYSLAYYSAMTSQSPYECFKGSSYNFTEKAIPAFGCYQTWWVAFLAAFLAPFSHQLFNILFKLQKSHKNPKKSD